MTTTYVAEEIDFEALNQPAQLDLTALAAEHRPVVEIVSHDWLKGDEDFATFVAVLMLCRRGPDDVVSSNDVRLRLLEDTVKGPRCAIEPRRYSSFFNRAQRDGYLRKLERDGDVVYEKITTSPTRNNGKLTPVFQWAGGPR